MFNLCLKKLQQPRQRGIKAIVQYCHKGGIMVKVMVSKKDSIDTVLRKFESKCRKAQIYKTLREKSHFISKSEKRHRLRNRRYRTPMI